MFRSRHQLAIVQKDLPKGLIANLTHLRSSPESTRLASSLESQLLSEIEEAFDSVGRKGSIFYSSNGILKARLDFNRPLFQLRDTYDLIFKDTANNPILIELVYGFKWVDKTYLANSPLSGIPYEFDVRTLQRSLLSLVYTRFRFPS